MKCPCCSYKHEGEYTFDGYKSTKGDDKFIEIYTEHQIFVDNPRDCTHEDYNYKDKVKADLKACPKCNTVILDID